MEKYIFENLNISNNYFFNNRLYKKYKVYY